MHKSTLNTLIIAIGLIVVAIIISSIFVESESITATGQSTIEVLPDYVMVYFNIQTQGDTSSEAQSLNDQIAQDLIDSIIALGFERGDIKTQGLSIYPEYDWGEYNKREIRGYTASHQIKIQLPVSERDKVSEVIDAGVDAGAGISYINFELSPENETAYKADAIKEATQDARTKAQAIAEGAGKRLGSLKTVSTSDFGYAPWRLYAAEDSGMGQEVEMVASNIVPSEQSISAQVTASFRIGWF